MQTYIKPSELKSKLETLISINKPAFIWGASGIGFTTGKRQAINLVLGRITTR